jgi:hypothetical protein
MQGAEVAHVFARDLKEAISNVKRDEYRRALGETHDPMVLNAMEHRVRTDSQLTQDDRVQLLGEIERVAALAR